MRVRDCVCLPINTRAICIRGHFPGAFTASASACERVRNALARSRDVRYTEHIMQIMQMSGRSKVKARGRARKAKGWFGWLVLA